MSKQIDLSIIDVMIYILNTGCLYLDIGIEHGPFLWKWPSVYRNDILYTDIEITDTIPYLEIIL